MAALTSNPPPGGLCSIVVDDQDCCFIGGSDSEGLPAVMVMTVPLLDADSEDGQVVHGNGRNVVFVERANVAPSVVAPATDMVTVSVTLYHHDRTNL